MGDGSCTPTGLRFCVADDDFDVVERLERLGKALLRPRSRTSAAARVTSRSRSHSVRLAQWWEACGFAKRAPREGHAGKGCTPHIPDAVLHTNDREVYRAFLRGLFEADGTVTSGIPTWTTASTSFADEVQSLLLALGLPDRAEARRERSRSRADASAACSTPRTTRAGSTRSASSARARPRGRFAARVAQAARHDHIPVTRELVDRLAPANDRLRKVAPGGGRASGGLTPRRRPSCTSATGDAELGTCSASSTTRSSSAELGDEEFTYDLSVPENVTYVANGFVSHNTIGLMMDCDTTGIEPDLALDKAKKLVGGGTMSIVNQTIPRALRSSATPTSRSTRSSPTSTSTRRSSVRPASTPSTSPVFACSMGDNTIHYMGHVKMMAAVQPFISGAISKCVVGDTLCRDGRRARAHRRAATRASRRTRSGRGHRSRLARRTQKTDAFYYGGLRPVRRGRAASGHRSTGTPNHRLLVGGAATASTGGAWTRSRSGTTWRCGTAPTCGRRSPHASTTSRRRRGYGARRRSRCRPR